jgi:hypothetical protein
MVQQHLILPVRSFVSFALQTPALQEGMEGFSKALEGKFNSRLVFSHANGNPPPTSSTQSSSTQLDAFINFPLQALRVRDDICTPAGLSGPPWSLHYRNTNTSWGAKGPFPVLPLQHAEDSFEKYG